MQTGIRKTNKQTNKPGLGEVLALASSAPAEPCGQPSCRRCLPCERSQDTVLPRPRPLQHRQLLACGGFSLVRCRSPVSSGLCALRMPNTRSGRRAGEGVGVQQPQLSGWAPWDGRHAVARGGISGSALAGAAVDHRRTDCGAGSFKALCTSA